MPYQCILQLIDGHYALKKHNVASLTLYYYNIKGGEQTVKVGGRKEEQMFVTIAHSQLGGSGGVLPQ